MTRGHEGEVEGGRRLFNALLRRFLGGAASLPDVVSDGPLREVSACAMRQGVVRHVLRVLEDCPRKAPWHDELRMLLKPSYQRLIAAAVKACGDGADALSVLDKAGVECVPFKGVFLSEDLYEDPCFRRPGDIDLMIRRPDLEKAVRALASIGYAADFPSPLIEEYYRVEYNEIYLLCPDRLTVDLHYAPHNDLPPSAHDETIARAGQVQGEGPLRRRPDPVDYLMLLSVNYWATGRWEHVHLLVDIAALLRQTGQLPEGWWERVDSWGLAFHVACVLEGVRTEFGLDGLDGPLSSLYTCLSGRERSVCGRVRAKGPGALPDGLVQKTHRLSLPFPRRLKLLRRFLWPHPGFVAHRKGKARPTLLDRLIFAGGRVRQALRAR